MITEDEVSRFRLIQTLIREQDAHQRQKEMEKQNRQCDRCWKMTIAALSILLVALAILDKKTDGAFALPTVITFCVLVFVLLVDGCVNLGIRF